MIINNLNHKYRRIWTKKSPDTAPILSNYVSSISRLCGFNDSVIKNLQFEIFGHKVCLRDNLKAKMYLFNAVSNTLGWTVEIKRFTSLARFVAILTQILKQSENNIGYYKRLTIHDNRQLELPYLDQNSRIRINRQISANYSENRSESLSFTS